jgi:dTDP-4-dehydrorhamnose reductase
VSLQISGSERSENAAWLLSRDALAERIIYEIACSVTNLRRIAIIGANGRLGAALAREYARDFEVTSFERRHLDLGQLDRVRSALAETKFKLLINCAALSNVDYCESHREEAFLVNAEAPRLLAEVANEKSAKLVHFSTDYVFDGKKSAPIPSKIGRFH